MRPEKESIVKEIKAALDATEFVFLADYSGMGVKDMSALRDALAESDAEMHIYKNSYLGVALGEELSKGLESSLTGPTSVFTGSGDATAIAKVLVKFKKENEFPVLKGGLLGDKVLTESDIDAMAKIPPREILLSQFVGTVQAPMTSLVGVMNAKVSSLLYVLNAIEEKKKNAA
jgi:large subunit ribosomal protein L10